MMLTACSSSGTPEAGTPEAALPLEPAAANPVNDDPNAEPELNLEGDYLIPPPAPELRISAADGILEFSWNEVPAGSIASLDVYHRDSRETETLVNEFEAGTTTYELPISNLLFDWQNTEYLLNVCSEADCLRSYSQAVDHLQHQHSTRLPNESVNAFDLFASAISSTSNGKLIIAGAPGHDVDDPVTAEAIADAGSASLFFEVAGAWWLGAELVAADPQYNSQFGSAVAVDLLGDTLVIGAPYADDTAGAVYVFKRAGETWIQIQKLVSANPQPLQKFGTSLAMSDDGMAIVVGASGDANPNQTPSSNTQGGALPSAGAVHLFRFNEESRDWTEVAYIRSDQITENALFGSSLSMDSQAQQLIVSAPGTSVDDNSRGILYVFDLTSSGLPLVQKLTLQAVEGSLSLGSRITLSGDGSTLVSSNRAIPASGGSRVADLRKPQTRINVYQRDSNGLFIANTTLTPAGVHGFESETALTVSDNGKLLAAAISNGDTSGNSVTVYELENNNWQRVNIFENPSLQQNEFANNIHLSGSGSRLLISAATTTVTTKTTVTTATGVAEIEEQNTAAGVLYLY